MKIETQAVRFTADQKLLDFIEQKLGKLEQFYDHIVSAEVYLRLENSGQVRDKIVEIKIHVPGNVLVSKETEKTFEAAVDSATDSLRRQIIRYKEKLSARR